MHSSSTPGEPSKLTGDDYVIGPPTAPAVAPLPAGQRELPPQRRSRRPVLWIASTIALALAAAALCALWVITKGDLTDSRRTAAALSGSLHAASATIETQQGVIDGYESAKASADAAAAEVPNLLALAQKHMPSIAATGGSDFVSFTVSQGVSGAQVGELVAYMSKLGFNAGGVVTQMGQTRAIDGTQTAEGKNCKASWTYHPDNGLQVVIQTTA